MSETEHGKQMYLIIAAGLLLNGLGKFSISNIASDVTEAVWKVGSDQIVADALRPLPIVVI